mgnify:CR=1 FL=1
MENIENACVTDATGHKLVRKTVGEDVRCFMSNGIVLSGNLSEMRGNWVQVLDQSKGAFVNLDHLTSISAMTRFGKRSGTVSSEETSPVDLVTAPGIEEGYTLVSRAIGADVRSFMCNGAVLSGALDSTSGCWAKIQNANKLAYVNLKHVASVTVLLSALAAVDSNLESAVSESTDAAGTDDDLIKEIIANEVRCFMCNGVVLSGTLTEVNNNWAFIEDAHKSAYVHLHHVASITTCT